MKTGLISTDAKTGDRRWNQMATPRNRVLEAPPVNLVGFYPHVSIQGYQYMVDFGPGETIRLHRVNKDKTCSCDAPFCEAIEVVRQYLQAGGQRAPEPANHAVCPICGAKTFPDHRWDGKYTKSLGWRCEKGGLRHFLEAKSERIKKQFAENPWLIPPVPGYPGVKRDEVMTWEECEAISRKVFLETGYDPTA
jgi:hypothetical protein